MPVEMTVLCVHARNFVGAVGAGLLELSCRSTPSGVCQPSRAPSPRHRRIPRWRVHSSLVVWTSSWHWLPLSSPCLETLPVGLLPTRLPCTSAICYLYSILFCVAMPAVYICHINPHLMPSCHLFLMCLVLGVSCCSAICPICS